MLKGLFLKALLFFALLGGTANATNLDNLDCSAQWMILFVFEAPTAVVQPNFAFQVRPGSGLRKKFADLTSVDFAEIEDGLLTCEPTAGVKWSRAEIHAKLIKIQQKQFEYRDGPALKTLESFKGKILNEAQLQQVASIKARLPELTAQVDAVLADQAHQKNESDLRIAREELRSLSGHQLVDAEIDRAHQIANTYPELSSEVDRVLVAAAQIKRDAAIESQRQQERAAAAKKIEEQKDEIAQRSEDERRRQQISEQLDQQNAKVQQAAKVAAFQQSLPSSCKDALALQIQMQSAEAQEKLNRAIQLSAAGEQADACRAFSDLSKSMEKLRAQLVACSKGLEGREEPEAKQISSGALSQAVNIHQNQAALDSSLVEMHCR